MPDARDLEGADVRTGRRIGCWLAVGVLLGSVTACATDSEEEPDGPDRSTAEFTSAVEDLEEEYDARVGLALVDVGSGEQLSHRADERFGFASTMKAYAAAALLDTTSEQERDVVVRWTVEDVEAAGYSPVTEAAVQSGLRLDELAEAAVRESDNLAMNLVLEELGGPEGLEEVLKGAGDSTSRPVDVEPDLNDVEAGEDDNTSTAEALAGTLERIATGEWLDEDDRSVLLDWMSDNATGDPLIRAGAPKGWQVADKSGGAGAIRNDVAVVSPPERAPIVLVVLTERNDGADYDDALVADVARLALEQVR